MIPFEQQNLKASEASLKQSKDDFFPEQDLSQTRYEELSADYQAKIIESSTLKAEFANKLGAYNDELSWVKFEVSANREQAQEEMDKF